MINIEIIPVFDDNYSYLLQLPCGTNAVIDPGQAEPIIKVIEEKNINLDFILNTHHHWDHTNGNQKLIDKYGAKIINSTQKNDLLKLGTEKLQIIRTPAHTLDSICFYFPNSRALFTGDTLFSMGCGRIFEGSTQDMFNSFQKIMALPDDTMIYPAHEYTRGNAGFCLSQDRDNEDLKLRIEEVKILNAQGKPTIPVSLKTEKKTNIFMKAKNAKEFTVLRIKKDSFYS